MDLKTLPRHNYAGSKMSILAGSENDCSESTGVERDKILRSAENRCTRNIAGAERHEVG
jgi:hypothetical protein